MRTGDGRGRGCSARGSGRHTAVPVFLDTEHLHWHGQPGTCALDDVHDGQEEFLAYELEPA